MSTPPKIGNDGTVFKCPQCKTILPNSAVPTFPFCSDRCRLLDLDAWLSGSYTLSRPIDPTDNLADIPTYDPAAKKPPHPSE
jgi:endogenous inhibitor of DNA gyrase (YacG/DUF329 family)